MNEKNIKSYLTGRHNKWLESIEDKELREEVRQHSLIAGGAIVSLLTGEQPNDIDVYLTDRVVARKLARHYVELWNGDARHSSKIGLLSGAMPFSVYMAWFETSPHADNLDNAYAHVVNMLEANDILPDELDSVDKFTSVDELIDAVHGLFRATLGEEYVGFVYPSFEKETLSDDYAGEKLTKVANEAGVKIWIRSSGFVGTLPSQEEEPKKDENEEEEKPDFAPVFITDNAISLRGKVQVILRFIGDAEEITSNFDFVHCTCTYVPSTRELNLPSKALVSILTKELVYTGSKYPICSLFRLRKFIERGYHVNAGQILKAVFQIKKLDLSNVYVLNDQLIGVDSLYMSELILQIREANAKGIDVNGGYVIHLIEEMFG